MTPFPSIEDIWLDREGSLPGALEELTDDLRRAVDRRVARMCSFAPDDPVPLPATEWAYGWDDAVGGLCVFFGVAEPLLAYLRVPVTILIVLGVLWRLSRLYARVSQTF